MFSGSAFAGDLVLSLDSPPLGYPPGTDTTDCQIEGLAPCIFFTGSITNTDNDPTSLIDLSGITITFTDPSVTYFTQDNAFYDYPLLLLSGDPNWATDNSGDLPNSTTGVIFGLSYLPDTPFGDYQFTAQLTATGGDDDLGDGIVSNIVTSDVVISPEPASSVLLLLALPLVAALRRRRSQA